MKKWWHSEILRNSRLAMPPRRTLVLVGLVYLIAEALQQTGRAIDAGIFGQIGAGPLWYLGAIASSEPSLFQHGQSKIMAISAMIFAAYRVGAYHPYFRTSYRTWLTTTCWHVGQALPLGPVTLTLTDALLLALATALFAHAAPSASIFVPIALFAAVYLIAIAVSLFWYEPRGGGYAVIFGLLGMLMYGRWPEVACLVAAPTYLVASFALRRSLARLWSYEPGWIAKNVASEQLRRRLPHVQLATAWPFGYLSPEEPAPGLPWFDAVCIAILGGYALFSLSVAGNQDPTSFIPPDTEARLLAFLAILFAASVALVRLALYCAHIRPPIGFWGRLARSGWLIPSYDAAFLAPSGTLLVLVLFTPGFLAVFRVPLAVEISITFTLALFLAILPFPSYRKWLLTSECRIVPTRMQ
jgi:hypothetical protein